MLNLRHLRAFCEVVATGSVSGASRVVHLSQPAVTKGITGLEAALDATLFVRRKTGMVKTDAGRILARRAERAMRFLRSGAAGARTFAQRSGTRGFARFDQLMTNAQIKALLAIAESGNFTLAARR